MHHENDPYVQELTVKKFPDSYMKCNYVYIRFRFHAQGN